MYWAFITIFLLSLLFICLVKYYSKALGLIDIPNVRSTHTTITPRGAGIGFFLAVAIVFPFFHSELMLRYPWVYLAIFLVFFIGLLDDRHTAAPKAKFIVISVATLLLCLDDLIIDDIGTFFGIPIHMGWLSLPFTVFSVVGFTNALNLIDGIDGLSGSLSIVILSALFYIGYTHDDTFIAFTALAFVVALLAFMLFNWHPATIFMGDSGSLTLGFVISVLSIKALAYLPAIAILYLVAIPLLDTIYVIMRRKRNGHSAFSPDQCHIHHLVHLLLHKNTKKTVLILASVQAVYTMVAIHLSKVVDSGWLLLFFIVNIWGCYIFFRHIIRTRHTLCLHNIR